MQLSVIKSLCTEMRITGEGVREICWKSLLGVVVSESLKGSLRERLKDVFYSSECSRVSYFYFRKWRITLKLVRFYNSTNWVIIFMPVSLLSDFCYYENNSVLSSLIPITNLSFHSCPACRRTSLCCACLRGRTCGCWEPFASPCPCTSSSSMSSHCR